MKYLCIYTPIIPDDTMPSAIHPTSENRAWRQRQIFKMFCTQFDLDKKQYQIEMYTPMILYCLGLLPWVSRIS